jgi:hypothetical protein
MRVVLMAALLAALAACAPKAEEKPCCAINTKALCESKLHAAGVTEDEQRVVITAEGACPTAAMSEARIREIANLIDASGCPQITGHIVLAKLEAKACRASPVPEPAALRDGDYTVNNPDETAACQAGLRARGLKDNEMWLMMHTPDGVCPNGGVGEKRIREIVGFWRAAGCTKHTPAEMLHALESGACGGDAG